MRFRWCLGLAAAIAIAPHAPAEPLPPGGSDSHLPLYSAFGTEVVETPMVPFSFSGNSGSVQEWVAKGYGANPYVNGMLGSDANALTFFYEVVVSQGDVRRVTGSDFQLFPLDVGYGYNLKGSIAPPGSVVPVSADRSLDGSVVGFNFSDVPAGQNSAIMIVNTNVDNYTSGTLGVFNGAQGQILPGSGYAPTEAPEPASWTLLGLTALCTGAYAWRRRRHSA